ncbi:hypothetical protein, partial [Mesorhizobium sp. M8A.F.Ca.ET.208.01.1.1]|uniref:hypothetical protein n=1 Tax=Mesorhizobium sp. M8A.F.Ca.ET.208.01.1.1 TaxID=2563969 RepID=UPI001AEE9686
ALVSAMPEAVRPVPSFDAKLNADRIRVACERVNASCEPKVTASCRRTLLPPKAATVDIVFARRKVASARFGGYAGSGIS